MKLAVKILTRSDLTFFEPLYRRLNAGNQKAINLNADVFINRLYPGIPEAAQQTNNEILVKLTIFGPGGAGAYTLSRAIVKGATYKNWRLNGEFVRDPEGQPGRFDALAEGDVAVLGFEGEPVPSALKIVFVASSLPSDRVLHNLLTDYLGGRRMAEIDPPRLSRIADQADADHQLWQLAPQEEIVEALEDAAQGGAKGYERLLRHSERTISMAELAKARRRAEAVGQEGEAIVHAVLCNEMVTGTLTGVEWTASKNAVSPFDFHVVTATGETSRIDAKSTTGTFTAPIHMSLAEVREAAQDAGPYLIYRVYGITDEVAKLRRSEDLRSFAKELLATLAHLPNGVTPDAFSIDVNQLSWGAEESFDRRAGSPDEE
ncbi:DUF3883 domain-containing protein [Blastochloris sulfoviridis]|uniref:DUF3883 domain-containing protein n=2 Tax=Blastochloris sulfoviridis TaxID=50712 RepID=A0A5M6I4Q3_9HYPH|nr:DUF3883 domain-containing protein [Blastochloris sulfoviridis]